MEQLLRNFLASGESDPQEAALLPQLLQHSLVLPGQGPAGAGGSPRGALGQPGQQQRPQEEVVDRLLAALLEMSTTLAEPTCEQQHEQKRQQQEACAVDDSPRVSEALALTSFAAVPVWGEQGEGAAGAAQEGAQRPGREDLLLMALQALQSLKVGRLWLWRAPRGWRAGGCRTAAPRSRLRPPWGLPCVAACAPPRAAPRLACPPEPSAPRLPFAGLRRGGGPGPADPRPAG
jgi:hypothetical protein